MIYQDVKRFLKRFLNKPSLKYKWTGKDNFLFLDFIQSRYSDEEINSNSIEIRQAFRDFFEPIGNTIVRFDRTIGIGYKILSYSIEPKDSKHLSNIINIIRENRRSVEYPYNNRKDQMALLGKIRRKINSEIIETQERVNKKELVRYAIKKALELDEKDVVLTLKKKYIIKLFNKNNFIKNQPINTVENQEAELVFDEEDLKEHYSDIFTEIKIIDFLDQVLTSIFVEKLNFKKITNVYYEQYALNIIKNKIIDELKEFLSDNEEYLSALAGYILKKNLISIHERIAIEIFELITNKNTNAKEFLNYYTGQIYVENGKRYTIPEITTEDGKRWNINSLMSTSTVWLRTRSSLLKLKAQQKNIEQKISECIPIHNSAKQQLERKKLELNKVLKEYKEFNQKIESDTLKLKKEEKGSMDKSKEIDLKRNIQNDRKTINKLRREINEYKLEKTELDATYSSYDIALIDHKQKKNILDSQINSLEQDLNLNSNAFNSVLSSVVKALIKRKKRVD